MAAWTPSDDDEYGTSSPDPLLASITENSIRAPKQALMSTSPNKQTRRSSITLSSPTKQMEHLVLNTPRTGSASPWRIKVTVQAEPGSDAENIDSSPSVKRVTRTKTTTVPLKDPDASSPAKRRGRPRKSDSGSAVAKRSGTPIKKRAASKTRRSSVGGSAADVETDATPKRKRGRPRKNVQAPVEDDAPVTESQDIWTDLSTGHTPAQPRRRGRPRNIDRSSSDVEPTPITEEQTPKESPPRQVSERKGTPAFKGNEPIEISSDEESDVDTPPESADDQGMAQEPELEEVMAHPDNGEPQHTAEEFDENDDDHFAFDEGATRMPDDTTIIDSENFSMISVDSLPSMTSPANGQDATPGLSIQNYAQLRLQSMGVPERQGPRAGTRSSPHVRVASTQGQDKPSPRAGTQSSPGVMPTVPAGKTTTSRYKTPSVEPGEISSPPQIEPARSVPMDAHTAGIGRVVTAGVALQGVLDPNRSTPDNKTADGKHRQFDDLFRGFSEKTRRDLQAGLRLGEQLAGQRETSHLSSPPPSSPSKVPYEASPPVQEHQSRLLTPEDQNDPTGQSENQVEYPTLHDSNQQSHLLSPASTPDESEVDDMSWRANTPPVQTASQSQVQSHSTSSGADVWDEIAGGSSDEPQTGLKPARGKLPRTWRKKSAGDFHYSDEAEGNSQVATPPTTESDRSPDPKADKGKAPMVQPAVEEESEDDSDRSDDTGMFFQNNIPAVYDQGRVRNRRNRNTQNVELDLHLDESLAPESSPPTSKTPVLSKPNPFVNTPPQLPAFYSSPMKSSPLRQELRNSDISSESVNHFDESTLPIAPSSPFHTYVEGDTSGSLASDQRQLINEMGGVDTADTSLRRIRDEADDYLDAYEPQERSLHDLTEYTEPSRTCFENSSIASSPPKPVQVFSNNIRGNTTATMTPRTRDKEPTQPATSSPEQPSSTPVPTMKKPLRLSSHPALAKLDQLPKVEPWTKTHYKALDKIYQLYKKQPNIFSLHDTTTAAINNALLDNFLATTDRNFINARYRAWGYNVIFTGPLVVLCAAFMQLLTCADMAEYERKSGKEIAIGDCGPGAAGTAITKEIVAERLATIVLGEAVRRDEKKGKVIDKSGRLRVEWPQ